MSEPPVFADVESAARALAGVAHRTPVLRSRSLDAHLGAEVHFKCENLQRVGAFKFRGAYNAISRLTPGERARGILSFSSGNHAQAVALACRLLECSATIVMPDDAPAAKRAATEGYGARVIGYARATQTREAVAEALLGEGGQSLIPPFDHPHVMAGQGTAALELLQDTPELDALLVPCGGGGLLSGCALAASALQPGCRVIGIEPELANDATLSFRSGRLQRIEDPRTVADGVRTPALGVLPFAVIRQHVSDMQTVSEGAIAAAMRVLYERLKLVVEPSGALGLAALLSGAVAARGRIGVVLSGGNVDPDTFCRLIRDARSIRAASAVRLG